MAQADTAATQQQPVWLRFSPGIFVLLWSTGFIGARWGLPYAEPFTFLALRFIFVIPLLIVIALVTRARWQVSGREIAHNIIVGILLHGIYLGGVFAAIERGMPVGLAALIAGLTPILTALAATFLLAERVTRYQWAGIALGFVGLVMVLNDKTGVTGASGWSWDWTAMAMALGALLGLSGGNLYQKHFGGGQDVRTATLWQYVGSAAFVSLLALLFETREVQWTGDFIFALSWLVLVLSFGAVSLLMIIIRYGEISRVAVLFYLVPPATGLMGFLFFGEAMGPIEIAGVAVTTIGVALVTRKAAPPPDAV